MEGGSIEPFFESSPFHPFNPLMWLEKCSQWPIRFSLLCSFQSIKIFSILSFSLQCLLFKSFWNNICSCLVYWNNFCLRWSLAYLAEAQLIDHLVSISMWLANKIISYFCSVLHSFCKMKIQSYFFFLLTMLLKLYELVRKVPITKVLSSKDHYLANFPDIYQETSDVANQVKSCLASDKLKNCYCFPIDQGPL